MRREKPIIAIEKFCWDCIGGSLKELEQCSEENCPFFNLRLGKVKK